MVPLMPAECTACGRRWQPANGIWIEDATQATFQGNTYSGCPDCGGSARFVDGTFDVADGAIDMISGPQWSWELVDALRLALQRTVADETDPGTAIAAVVPEVGHDFEVATRGKSREFKLGVAAFVFGLITADYDNVVSLIRSIEIAFRYVGEHGSLPGS